MKICSKYIYGAVVIDTTLEGSKEAGCWDQVDPDVQPHPCIFVPSVVFHQDTSIVSSCRIEPPHRFYNV